MGHENTDQAAALFQTAIELDLDFAMAHLRLSQCYSAVVGKNEKALTELERAYALRQGVTDREQRRIEADYFDLHERYEDGARSLTLLVHLYPEDAEAHEELAISYYNETYSRKDENGNSGLSVFGILAWLFESRERCVNSSV